MEEVESAGAVCSEGGRLRVLPPSPAQPRWSHEAFAVAATGARTVGTTEVIDADDRRGRQAPRFREDGADGFPGVQRPQPRGFLDAIDGLDRIELPRCCLEL